MGLEQNWKTAGDDAYIEEEVPSRTGGNPQLDQKGSQQARNSRAAQEAESEVAGTL